MAPHACCTRGLQRKKDTDLCQKSRKREFDKVLSCPQSPWILTIPARRSRRLARAAKELESGNTSFHSPKGLLADRARRRGARSTVPVRPDGVRISSPRPALSVGMGFRRKRVQGIRGTVYTARQRT